MLRIHFGTKDFRSYGRLGKLPENPSEDLKSFERNQHTEDFNLDVSFFRNNIFKHFYAVLKSVGITFFRRILMKPEDSGWGIGTVFVLR